MIAEQRASIARWEDGSIENLRAFDKWFVYHCGRFPTAGVVTFTAARINSLFRATQDPNFKFNGRFTCKDYLVTVERYHPGGAQQVLNMRKTLNNVRTPEFPIDDDVQQYIAYLAKLSNWTAFEAPGIACESITQSTLPRKSGRNACLVLFGCGIGTMSLLLAFWTGMDITILSAIFVLVAAFFALGLASLVLSRIRIFDHFGAQDVFDPHILGPPSSPFDPPNLPRFYVQPALPFSFPSKDQPPNSNISTHILEQFEARAAMAEEEQLQAAIDAEEDGDDEDLEVFKEKWKAERLAKLCAEQQKKEN